ncbi:hypothetical protein GWC77_14080 [Paraburkholderia sp. NMBU_R16]|uniref:DUF6708 domain-containing protein n=1 Tax=Paraburkholderia sp. NMBU_R16 TaxID=2698676 RepID=UPI0015652DD0|nr:DUF6708 domain-containing protein [Paraburkholderia sp. NMBU_R16]NRO97050.1 hypothetical protein [Paraburkholderia sp. NMBU_R16]
MDERLLKKCVGLPVPKWDLEHRLSTDLPVSPDIWDTGTVFKINATYMDVTEPSLLEKHWFITGVFLAFIFIGIGPYVYWLTNVRYPYAGGVAGDIFAAFISLVFATIVWKLGRGLFFGLSYRPIRFHRETRKLYAIRARRFFAKSGQGDVVWEAPWTAESLFCLHKEVTQFNTVYHIRHYTVDEKGNVTRVFSIGREWVGAVEVELALAQWNYWCKYMNDGPNNLPKPLLFHTQNETPRESFLFSLYGVGMRAPVLWRVIMMPFILVFTAMRIFANATCRAPVWPEAVEKISTLAPQDPYAEPRPGTPVGWAETVLAQRRGDYPNDPKGTIDGWSGEPDGRLHAAAWLTSPGR